MGKFRYLIIFWLIWCQPLEAQNIDSLLAQARYLYENRHLADSYFEQSKEQLEKILLLDQSNEEALWRLAEIYFCLGNQTNTKSEKTRYFERGKALAETLINFNDKNPWGHFWFAANYGKLCEQKGIFQALSGIEKVKAELNRVLELDSENCDALYALGALYYQLPRLAGGNKNLAIEYFQKAITANPNFSLPYLDLARHYIQTKKIAEARKLLNQVLAINEPKSPADYFLKDRPTALNLLKKIEKKE